MSIFNRKGHIVLGILGILFSIWVVYGFIRAGQEADIIQLEYNDSNPICYVFPVSVSTVRDSMIQWTKKDPKPMFKYFFWHNDSNSENYFQLSGYNSYSYIYRYVSSKANSGRNVRQDYDYGIHLHSVSDDSTLVAVYLERNQITTGVRFWTNICFKNYVPKEKSVPSSTIEEYELLRYIGKKLGCLPQMPYVKYPPQLSREEILKTFGEANPFTYEEMFE